MESVSELLLDARIVLVVKKRFWLVGFWFCRVFFCLFVFCWIFFCSYREILIFFFLIKNLKNKKNLGNSSLPLQAANNKEHFSKTLQFRICRRIRCLSSSVFNVSS